MKVIALLGTIITTMAAFAQRAPVRFIPIDSISIIRKEQNVKLDFKTKDTNVTFPRLYPGMKGARPVPESTGWVGDTIYLTLDGERIEFIEHKGKTVDWYLFAIECLESKTYKQGHALVIRHSTIQDIRADSILFRLTIELFKEKNDSEWETVNSRIRDIWIKSKELDGVLISEIDGE